jgi:hypothetical protein
MLPDVILILSVTSNPLSFLRFCIRLINSRAIPSSFGAHGLWLCPEPPSGCPRLPPAIPGYLPKLSPHHPPGLTVLPSRYFPAACRFRPAISSCVKLIILSDIVFISLPYLGPSFLKSGLILFTRMPEVSEINSISLIFVSERIRFFHPRSALTRSYSLLRES